jgi:hypothetical protein
VKFAPFEGIDVEYEPWVPESQVICARMLIKNGTGQMTTFRFEMIAQLTPIREGRVMIASHEQVTTLLQGETDSLRPVLFLTGGPEAGSGSYPSLGLNVCLEEGESRTLYWASAALNNAHDSFELARRSTARSWEAELSRIELTRQSTQVEVESDKPGWDEIFRLGQNHATRLFMNPSIQLPETSFVAAREPDLGFPGGEQGSSHGTLWNGQPIFQAIGLSQVVLPGNVEIVRGWVRNQLSTQEASGKVDWKPGLAGQRGRLHVQPGLATLALYAATGEKGERFLKGCFEGLQRYLGYWFQSVSDRDQDGFPEWEHPFQVGFDDQASFDSWKPDGKGVEINTIEAPALGAWLYQECSSLIEIAQRIGQPDDVASIEQKRERLREAIQECWDENQGSYLYRDRDIHACTTQETLFNGPADRKAELHLEWEAAKRLQIQVMEGEAPSPAYRVKINGRFEDEEQVETLRLRGNGWATSQLVYTRLERIEAEGAIPGDMMRVTTPDLKVEDLSLYLPLWAGIPTNEQAKRMIPDLLRRYLSPYGLTQLPAENGNQKVSPFWNGLIVEGLLRYGFRTEANEVFAALMEAFQTCVHQSGDFYQFYQADNGLGHGICGHVDGLPPIQTYLKLMGLEIRSPWDIFVTNTCAPFTTFTVKYRGLKYTNQNTPSRVTYPDGQSIAVEQPGEYHMRNVHGKHSPPY